MPEAHLEVEEAHPEVEVVPSGVETSNTPTGSRVGSPGFPPGVIVHLDPALGVIARHSQPIWRMPGILQSHIFFSLSYNIISIVQVYIRMLGVKWIRAFSIRKSKGGGGKDLLYKD